MYIENPIYKIGDVVFYATPEADRGIVVNWSYSAREKLIKYCVSFGRLPDDQIWCYPEELSTCKVF